MQIFLHASIIFPALCSISCIISFVAFSSFKCRHKTLQNRCNFWQELWLLFDAENCLMFQNCGTIRGENSRIVKDFLEEKSLRGNLTFKQTLPLMGIALFQRDKENSDKTQVKHYHQTIKVCCGNFLF